MIDVCTGAPKLGIFNDDTGCAGGTGCSAPRAVLYLNKQRSSGGRFGHPSQASCASARLARGSCYEMKMIGGRPYLIPPVFIDAERTPILLGRSRIGVNLALGRRLT